MIRSKPVAALLTVAVLASACSSTVPGAATPVASAGKIDTGNFPTTPREVKAVNAADAWQQEGFNMADSVVAPFDVRPDLAHSFTGRTVGPVVNLAELIRLIPAETLIRLRGTSFESGFVVGAANENADTRLTVALLRFYSPDTAGRAIDLMSDSTVPEPQADALAQVPGGSSVAVDSRDGMTRFTAVARFENLVALASSDARDAGTGATLVAEALNAQLAKAPSYRQNDPLSQTEIPKVPMDRDGIMSRTLTSLPDAAQQSDFGFSSGVRYLDGYYSRRTRYLINLLPAWRESAETNGVDLIGNTGSAVVMRARDNEAARRFLLRKGTGDSAVPDVQRVPGIPRETGAHCVDTKTGNNAAAGHFACFIVVGRWAVQVQANTLPLAEQSISAEYLILKAAG